MHYYNNPLACDTGCDKSFCVSVPGKIENTLNVLKIIKCTVFFKAHFFQKWITLSNLFPVDNTISFPNTFPLDSVLYSDLSD